MVLHLHYDNVFHQHLRYYSMKPLIHLFRQYGMDVFHVEHTEVHGGSIRVYAAHAGDFKVRRSVRALLALEEKHRLYEPKTHARFARQVHARGRRLFEAVYRAAEREKKKVVGIGAPAKAATICNYARLGPDLVEYVTEVNPLRVGRYLPGVHIPIVAEERMFADRPRPQAGILFAWNYRAEIEPKLRARGFKGRILLP
jgi:hypothetical protein